MAKKGSRRKQIKRQQRQTNWTVMGAIITGGILIFAGLIYLAVRPSTGESAATESLETYCDENEGACIVRGNESAPVTIVEISDFGCVFCKEFNMQTAPLINEQYVEAGDVRYIVLPYSSSSKTMPAANGGVCAAEQGLFWEYSHAMFADFDAPDHLDTSGIERAAESVGLEMKEFSDCLASGRYNSRIQVNRNTAIKAGVSATPTFFINDQIVEGALPWATFQQRINTWLDS